jgi:hypothetical protein
MEAIFNIKKVLFLLLPGSLFLGCQTSRTSSPSSQTQVAAQENHPLEIKADQRTFPKGKTISFFIENPTDSTYQLSSTRYLNIEHWDNNQWKMVPYTPCICGAPCQPPAPADVRKGQQLRISWNQQAVRCDYESGAAMPETHKQQVEAGRYRMNFSYTNISTAKRSNSKTLHFEFEIEELDQ